MSEEKPDEVYVDPKIVKYFTGIYEDGEQLREKRRSLQDDARMKVEEIKTRYPQELEELERAMQQFEEAIKPEIDELNDSIGFELKRVELNMRRLRIDIEEGWDRLFLYHDEYRGRDMVFDGEDKVFRFHSEGKSSNLIKGIKDLLDGELPFDNGNTDIED